MSSLLRPIVALALALVVANLAAVGATGATPADLTSWTDASFPGDGSAVTEPGIWVVDELGTAVAQTWNGAPTFFVSPQSAAGKRISATFDTPTIDDDFFGFAVGFEPDDIGDASADYVIVDWKKADQSINWFSGEGPVVGSAGLAVSRVNGIPNFDELWGHTDQAETSGRVTELARGASLGDVGWSGASTYDFVIEYTTQRLRVWVDDTLQLDVSGDFPDGRFSLYNFSLARMGASGITFERLDSPPEVTAAPDIVVDEGEVGATSGAITDPDGDALTLTCAGPCDGFDDGDGAWTWSQLLAEGPNSFAVTVTASNGSTFDASAAVSDTFEVTVHNVSPVITATSDVVETAPVDAALTVTADFSDAGVEDTHTALFEWGDGQSSHGSVTESAGSGTASATHAYAEPGSYVVSVTVEDDDGGTATATLGQVVVFDPGIFVTGGGWVASPAGAWTEDGGHHGKATFGFVVRHTTSGGVEGNLQFQLHKGLNLHATGFDYLYIGDGTAWFSGFARVNGTDGYRFSVVATDGRIAGTGEHLFSITVTGGEATVYGGSAYPDGGLPTKGKGIKVHTRG